MTSQDITALTTMLTDMQTQLQGEFDKINQRLDAHDAQFSQIDQRFSKVEFRMDRFEGRLEQFELDTKAGFDRVNATLDGIVGQLDRDDTERVALSAQVTRHEDWLVKNAPTLGVTYTPGA